MATGEYLTFLLGAETFGLDMARVREVVGGMTVARMPNLPPCVRGLINLRGRLVSVFDLRQKFGLAQQEDTSRTCIVIVDLPLGSGVAAGNDFPSEDLAAEDGPGSRGVVLGILVDQVSDVVSIDATGIDTAEELDSDVPPEFIAGLARHGDLLVHVLAGDRVFPLAESAAFVNKHSAVR